jgi:hypothetical protein
MYFLSKCSEKGCKRTGAVALNFDDKYCNLHSKIEITKKVEFENKDEENPQEIKPRLEDEDNKLE